MSGHVDVSAEVEGLKTFAALSGKQAATLRTSAMPILRGANYCADSGRSGAEGHRPASREYQGGCHAKGRHGQGRPETHSLRKSCSLGLAEAKYRAEPVDSYRRGC